MIGLNIFDWLILVILAISTFYGVRYGLIKALFSILGVFIGWLLAGQLSGLIGENLPGAITNESVTTVISYGIIIILSMLASNYAYKISMPLLSVSTLGISNLIDKIGGSVLGLIVGITISGICLTGMARITYALDLDSVDNPSESVLLDLNNSLAGLETKLTTSQFSPTVLRIFEKLPGTLPNEFKGAVELFKANVKYNNLMNPK
jgi:uncharacterized membrane protein required for colicin V production